MANEASGRSEIIVPDIGDFADVDVVDVLVSVGETVAVETPLITLETDKATIDVPSTAAGRIVELKVGKGDKVSQGTVIAILEPAAGESASEAPPTEATDDARDADAEPSAHDAKAAPARSTQSGSEAAEPIEMRVPDLGDFADVEIIEVLVAAGDQLEPETPLVTLETEKATMDVPATSAGKVLELFVKKGDRVSQGDRLLAVAPADAARETRPTSPEPGPESGPASAARPAPATERSGADETLRIARTEGGRSPIDEPGFARAHASPSVRRFARELGANLIEIKGTGTKGRITQADVKAWVKGTLSSSQKGATGAALPQVPEVDFAKFGPVEIEPLGRIQRISGPRLHASWVNVPHVWQMDEADITDLEKLRKDLKDDAAERGIKLTPLAFITRAVVRTIAEFPRINSSFDAAGQSLVLKKYLHMGFAADTPQGLVVPVIRDADRKDVYELARELATLSEKARSSKLAPAEMQGGCFTISSLGGIGGTAFTPIINAPEVAILGVSRSRLEPVYVNGELVPRLILPYSLAYDHRVIDGADAVRFTTRLAEILGDAAALAAAVP
jgi:pyruvate dehydrogenase E2 component (dihydrolipoamide acetyltransferase)